MNKVRVEENRIQITDYRLLSNKYDILYHFIAYNIGGKLVMA